MGMVVGSHQMFYQLVEESEEEMKKIFGASSGILSLLAFLTYTGSHIWTSVVLFKVTKLWAFLVILLIPGIGDLMGLYVLCKIKFFIPFIAYGACIVLWILSAAFANAVDK